MATNEKSDLFQLLNRMSANQMFSRVALSQLVAGGGHYLDEACGYPSQLSFEAYKTLIDREGIAKRVVSMLPAECWSVKPWVYETEDMEGEAQTPFEKAWMNLIDNTDLLSKLHRHDEVSGYGSYGVMLIWTGRKLEIPFPGIDKNGKLNGEIVPHELLYTMPYSEGDAQIIEWEKDTSSTRYGKPLYYNLNFVNPSVNASNLPGATQKVHWTHCHHAADGCTTSDVIGTPRLQDVFNYILNIRKVMGGSAEMFWHGGFPGTAFTVPPELANSVELDKDELKKELEEYYGGFKRYLALQGVEANQLHPNIADPDTHIKIQLMAIAIAKEVPLRMLMGTEEARLASMQDSESWNRKVHKRHDVHVTPNILRPIVDRFIMMGILPKPANPFFVKWPDVYSVSQKDKADITGKLVRALAEYIKSGAYLIFPPLQFFTMIMDLTTEEAEEVIVKAHEVAESGEFDFLIPPEEAMKAGVTGEPPRRRPAMGDTRKVRIAGLELTVNPAMKCQLKGNPGYKYGESGKCYSYISGDEASRKKALKKAKAQGAALEIGKHLRAMEEEEEKLNAMESEGLEGIPNALPLSEAWDS